jgi:dipeptidyl aminopeptidase/acylaminoacyl peptidase
MRPTDLPLLNSVSEPTLSPDGTVAVVSVTRPDLDADAYVGQLWTVPTRPVGGAAAPRRLTRGFRDTAPQFSPNGRLLGFLRATADGPAQLYVMAAGGGEPVQVTDRRLGVLEFTFAPDGATLAFVSREPEPGRYGTVDGLGPGAEPARRITTLSYTQNGLGYDLDRRAQVFTVPVPDVHAEPVIQPAPGVDGPAEKRPTVPQPRRLTSADTDHRGPAFSPDGRTLAVIAAVHPTRDVDRRTDIVLIDLDEDRPGDGEPRPATAGLGPYAIDSLAHGPDGALYFLASELGPEARDFVGRSHSLYVLDRPGIDAGIDGSGIDGSGIDGSGGTVRRLTDPADLDLGENCPTILPRADGTVLVVAGDRGRHHLVEIGADGGCRSRTTGAVAVSGIAATDDPAGPVVISYEHPGSFGDLALVGADGTITALTDFSAAIRDRGLVTPTELEITGRDGYPVHGWVAVPDGDGPHPVLLMIHGGPFASYGVGAFDETQVLVDAGYAVAYCNPRGSRGYGEDHGRSIRQQMGTVDLADVLDFLDGAVAADPRLDGDRTGILGGSYGGYLTAWATAHDHRWRGAIVERGFLDPEVFFGTSDIGSFFGIEYVGTDPDRVRAQSPQAQAHRVSTPTLVLHSEQDLRCPLDQAQRYYATLKTRGVETELVIFPGENHELSRSGRPRHRLQRFEVILDWWRRRLPVGG